MTKCCFFNQVPYWMMTEVCAKPAANHLLSLSY